MKIVRDKFRKLMESSSFPIFVGGLLAVGLATVVAVMFFTGDAGRRERLSGTFVNIESPDHFFIFSDDGTLVYHEVDNGNRLTGRYRIIGDHLLIYFDGYLHAPYYIMTADRRQISSRSWGTFRQGLWHSPVP